MQAYPQNLQIYLWDRESGYNRQNLRGYFSECHMDHKRRIFASITPNLTVQNVDKPLYRSLKFTPDGKYLLGVSQLSNQSTLTVLTYKGIGRASKLLQRQTGECVTAEDSSRYSLRIRQKLFGSIFTKKWMIPLPSNRTVWDYCVFLGDSRFAVLSSTPYISRRTLPRNNVDPDAKDNLLFAFKLIFIDLHSRRIIKKKRIESIESAPPSLADRVSVFGDRIAVVDKVLPSLTVYAVSRGGEVGTVCNVGKDRTDKGMTGTRTTFQTFLERCVFSYLKNKIFIAHLGSDTPSPRFEDNANFIRYKKMTVSRIHLLSATILFIWYEEDNLYESRLPYLALYVFYDITKKKIIEVFENDSAEMVSLLRDCWPDFRNIRTSPRNSAYLRPTHSRNMKVDECFMLGFLSQKVAMAPYLDYDLFIYKDVIRPTRELIKDRSIIFTHRSTGIVKFRLSLQRSYAPERTLETVKYVCHPFEPFIISVQWFDTLTVVNFHLYNPATNVSQN